MTERYCHDCGDFHEIGDDRKCSATRRDKEADAE